jgi:hypothetical protein
VLPPGARRRPRPPRRGSRPRCRPRPPRDRRAARPRGG